MKVIALLFAAVMAVTSVYATANPEAKTAAKTKAKTEAKTEAKTVEDVEEPVFHRWCYRPGQPCWKAKRALEEINEVFDAHFGDEN